ncbi:helix-turn-helix domain-containing protein [Pedobacter paludis]|uniref:XRE family transcriptional regulator n=1 Tax=Pedobacter paludis TaxID=2203212 RepID=A0A317EX12_9SPHI|nr:helix-turn-helix transcriptional regulator [Pedobacter paludis]PWS30279.1 XRE family transcriptional regulator [Pedobacter paludis]
MEKTTIKQFKLDLAKRIKQLRKSAGLTQSALAIKIGFKDKQIVNTYELKGANPTAYNLVLIANALNVTLDELLDFSQLGVE